MKSQHKKFDEALRERLRLYTEEPREDLWQGIAVQAASTATRVRWTSWVNYFSVLTIFGILVSASLKGIERRETGDVAYRTPPSQVVPNDQPTDNLPNENQENMQTKRSAPQGSDRPNATAGEKSMNPDHQVAITQPLQTASGSDSIETKVEVFLEIRLPTDHLQELELIDTIMTAIQIAPEEKTAVRSQKQTRNLRRAKHVPLKMYFSVMPTIGYQRIESNQSDDIIIENIDHLSALSTQRLGVRVELGAEFPIKKRLNGFAGILYYQQNQVINYTEKSLDSTLVLPGQNPGDIIVEPQFVYQDKTVDYEIKNIGIQLGVNYKLTKSKPSTTSTTDVLSPGNNMPERRFLHLVGTGVEFHKALNSTNASDQTEFSNPTAYLFWNVYYRMQYPSEGKLKAIFQPSMNYAFYIKQNLNAPFYVKPYGIGLNIGFTYNF